MQREIWQEGFSDYDKHSMILSLFFGNFPSRVISFCHGEVTITKLCVCVCVCLSVFLSVSGEGCCRGCVIPCGRSPYPDGFKSVPGNSSWFYNGGLWEDLFESINRCSIMDYYLLFTEVCCKLVAVTQVFLSFTTCMHVWHICSQ